MKIKHCIFFNIVFLFLCIVINTAFSQTKMPFDRMDRNNDGQLSRQEFRGKPRAFNRMDRNGDGFITRKEAAGTPLLGGERKVFLKEKPNNLKKTANKQSVNLSDELIFVDTHNHIVGWKGKGAKLRYDYKDSLSNIMTSMDQAGVKISLIMPMPQSLESEDRRLSLDDLLPIKEKYSDRFCLIGGGGSLNVMIQQAAKKGHVSSGIEQEFDAKALELVKKGAVGFGELTAEHFSMGEGHPYESVSPDHELFLRLADLSAKYDVPIDIHMEAIEKEMNLPKRLKSPPNPKVLKPNINKFERLLAHNRKAKIIWAHLGWDNTGQRTVELTRKLLLKHPNLYCSIRIASGMQERAVDKPTFPLESNGKLKSDWLTLFKEFPDRFVIGSDEIVQRKNQHPSAGSIRSTLDLLKQLPTDLQRKIGYENAYRLYKLQ